MTNGQSWNPIYQKLNLPDRNQEDGLDSQLACSYECDLGGAMFWMCLEPGDFLAWAFRLHLLQTMEVSRSLGAHQSLSESVDAPATKPF